MFEEEKQKLEKRKYVINQVDIPVDRIHMSVRKGFEKAKQEKTRKRRERREKIIRKVFLLIVMTGPSFLINKSIENHRSKTEYSFRYWRV